MKAISAIIWPFAVVGTLFLQLAFPAPGQAAPRNFEMTKVAENVFSFRSFFHRNMIVLTTDGVIVTDPMNVGAAKMMLAEIKKLTDKPVKYVIYSHNHWDHIAGAGIFKEQGAKIVQHELGAKGTRANPSVVPADTIWSGDQHDIKLGNQTIELHYVGPSHGRGMTVMRLPEQKILHTIDTVTPKRIMFMNMPDYIPYRLIEALKKIEAMDFERIVPGHGAAVASRSAVTEARQYMQDLNNAVSNAIKITKNPFAFPELTKLVKQELRPKYGQWSQFDAWMTMNIMRIVQEQRMGWN